MPKSRISGIGSSVPKKIISNKDLEKIVDTSDEWITRRTGIRERRIACPEENESTWELATRASIKAMDMAGVKPDDLEMIIMGTVTPDRQLPAASCMVQTALKARNAAAFDVSAGCSGFLYALSMADNAIRAGTCKNVLVIGAERLSSIVNWEDRNTCVLLADGAGAVVITPSSNGKGVLTSQLKSDGKYWDLLYASYGNHNHVPDILGDVKSKPFFLKMEGNRLYKKAISCMAAVTRDALAETGLACQDIDVVIPHQANIRIMRGLAKSLGIPMEKVYSNIHRYGNTSSATIPIAMDEAYQEGFLKRGQNVLLVSFGAGLTWGASILKWDL
ncbi:MAG: ketoacyl-ACP synthase III [Deltaproteobacteria bacterium]|nr:ketoacyl-ACP synthase III [Deltaproteobacteria bacterium]MBW2015835.1 ketoacyl-ACP synthase III [Deltaproteobacteria bacterium]MBW2128852.1 ketoacyl-ACP synthase III [Deltaproteobacteria bacterium]MBW2304439.1 ketoacyl-ACP synthase III [Deltaproteobacteria bacterium]